VARKTGKIRLIYYEHMLKIELKAEGKAMPRRKCYRRISGPPRCGLYKPAGVPAKGLEEVVLELDEFEALRLADAQGLYQEAAAEHMNVSRQTFGRIVDAARHKVATALVNGWALRIEGGRIHMDDMRTFTCQECGHVWHEPFGTGRPDACPQCKGANFCRTDEARGQGGGGMGRGGRGGGQCRGGGGAGRGGRGGGGGGGGRGQGGGKS